MHCIQDLLEQPDILLNDSRVHIIDGNVLLQTLVHLLNTSVYVFRRLPALEATHFVTDIYKTDSIKHQERLRCGSSLTLLIGGSKTRLQ